MTKPTTKQMVRFRVDLSPLCSIGPGKIELLESIARTGSLSQASRVLGLSYRRAWLLLDDLNRSFRAPVTLAKVGNRRSGMTLTALGNEIVRSYRLFGQKIELIVQSKLHSIAAKATRRPSQKSVPSRKRLARRLLSVERT